MSLEGEGATCTHPDCSEFDFLPARCAACTKLFCHVHFVDHGCTSVQKGKEDRRVEEGGEKQLSEVTKKPCHYCGDLVRHLVHCGEPACGHHSFCLPHRHHAVHMDVEGGGLSRKTDAVTETTAAVRNRQLRSEFLLGTRRNLPLKLGRFPPGISSQGVLVALLLPSNGKPHIQKMPTQGGATNEPFCLHVGHAEKDGSSVSRDYPNPKCVATTSTQHLPSTQAGDEQPTSLPPHTSTLSVEWNLSFVTIAQGSSLGNALDCIRLHNALDFQPGQQQGPMTCAIARSKQCFPRPCTTSSSSSQPTTAAEIEVFESLSPLVQDALSNHALLVVAPKLMFSSTDEAQEAFHAVMRSAAGMLGGFLPLSHTAKDQNEGKKQQVGDDEESKPFAGGETAKQDETDKNTVGGIQVDPSNTELVYPQLTELKFSAAGSRAVGRDHTKGAQGGPLSVIAIAVFPLIPLPSSSYTSATLTLPPPFCIWISNKWPLGKVIDRIVAELTVHYDVLGAAKTLMASSGGAAGVVVAGLSLYSLTTGVRVTSNADLAKLSNKEVVGLYVGSQGLPASVCKQLDPLVAGGSKNAPKELKAKMVKDCCLM